MGLDFNHAEAHWSYSGFHRFRTRLAKMIGIQALNFMNGFGGEGRWEDHDDPITILLSHSDCDGTMTPRECSKVAPRLREMVENWDSVDYDRINALLLADGMDYCALKKKNLEFR